MIITVAFVYTVYGMYGCHHVVHAWSWRIMEEAPAVHGFCCWCIQFPFMVCFGLCYTPSLTHEEFKLRAQSTACLIGYRMGVSCFNDQKFKWLNLTYSLCTIEYQSCWLRLCVALEHTASTRKKILISSLASHRRWSLLQFLLLVLQVLQGLFLLKISNFKIFQL